MTGASGLEVDARVRAGGLVLDVSLQVGAGETVAVLGPNGSGKSTLLRVICGLAPLDAGTVRLDGRVLDEPAARTRLAPEDRSVGIVFQDLLLFPGMDAADNVAFGLRARGERPDAARRTALAWLDRLGLGALADADPTQLSGGEAQRIALARALAPGPRALLLDEPLAALDADARTSLRRTLREHLVLHGGPCVIVTHDPLDAAVLADRVVVLEAGRITASGALADLVERPRTRWAAELAGTNLLPATASGGRVTLPGGATAVAADPPPDGPVLVAVRPAAVTLHRQQPEGSARNVWPLTVAGVEGFGERVRVRLDGEVALVAEITATSSAALAIGPGVAVWASVKASDVTAYPA